MTKHKENLQDSDISHFGKILRLKREELNISKNSIAEKLRVKERDISAIESNDLSNVSPNLYLHGIISEYSKIVDINESDIVQKYHNLNSNSQNKKDSKIRVKIDGDQNHSPEREIFFISFVGSLIIIFILLFYYNFTINNSHTQVRDFIENQELK